MRILPLVAALALIAPTAEAYTARNGQVVVPTGADTFEVRWRGRSGATSFWCAAGEYAVNKLHVPPTQHIYRMSSTPRGSGKPMSFTLDPAKSGGETGLATIGGGDSLSAGAAQGYCEIDQRRSRRR